MKKRGFILVLGIFAILIFAMGAYSANDNHTYDEIVELLQNTNSSDLTGCCSIVCQLEGNDSLMSFRRDSKYSADIFVEQIDWHGKPAIKQYKTEQGYFCQVIVTSDGWTIGYGGLDDGPDNEYLENLTADMVLKNNISEEGLKEIQRVKVSHGRGHAVIKAPDGNYGAVVNNTHFTGKLEPGQYISTPNKYSYYRSGDIQLNTSDKVQIMNKLEISDGYGLERRDITTYYFHQVDNNTFKGNITDIFASNDDGSFYGMKTGGLTDNIHFNGSVVKGSSLPIAPNYTSLGTVKFEEPRDNSIAFALGVAGYAISLILIAIIAVLIIRTINKIRYSRRNNRNRGYYQQNKHIRLDNVFHPQKQDRNTKDLWGTQDKRKRR